MIYRNTKTGAVVKSSCVIRGNGWEPAEDDPLPTVPQDTQEPAEAETVQEGAEKPKAKRGKK